ncbi:MAG: TadE/TadG family type IV pilus assembly protein [Planctomycetota bacterium]
MDDQRKVRPRRGTMIVETAIMLPLLLLLTFGGLKYGWLFIKWQQTTNVARHAVRYAVRPSPADPPAGYQTPGQLIDTFMVNYDMPKYILVELTDGAAVGSPVVVQIDVPVADIDILKMPFLPTPTTLSARMTMSKEGP